MQRGFLVLALQILISLLVTGVGLRMVFQPYKFQRFMNVNFALLPTASNNGYKTRLFIIIIGVYLIWYGYTLLLAFKNELYWLGQVFHI